VLKSKTEKLFSNYYYIKYFRYLPRRDYKDPVEFRYTFTSLKIALNFILELSEEKLRMQPGECFQELVRRSRTQSRGVQTLIHSFVPQETKYKGPIATEHFLNNPQDLELFIQDYFNLVNHS